MKVISSVFSLLACFVAGSSLASSFGQTLFQTPPQPPYVLSQFAPSYAPPTGPTWGSPVIVGSFVGAGSYALTIPGGPGRVAYRCRSSTPPASLPAPSYGGDCVPMYATAGSTVLGDASAAFFVESAQVLAPGSSWIVGNSCSRRCTGSFVIWLASYVP